MGKKEVEEYLQQWQKEHADITHITADDINQDSACAWCGTEMPYVEFNDRTPATDYIIHVLPGEDEYTPTSKALYCSSNCFINQQQELLSD